MSGAKVEDGIAKIAKHILKVDPDIVGLQEVYPGLIGNLTELLGSGWSAIQHSNETYPDTAILTKHRFLENESSETRWTLGVPVAIDDHTVVNVWNLHLYHRSYGPYAAFNKLVVNESQIMAGERTILSDTGRAQNVEELLYNNTAFNEALKVTDERPLVAMGDFNAPSHLDWTERTKDLHGGWAFEWPSTKLLMDYAQLTDSYREMYPDERLHPGHTWSTVQKFYGPEWDYTIPEPQDRIDFILYRSSKLKVTNSFTYQGTEPLKPIPDHWENDYPSDHFAVITDFTLSVSRK
jgi:endonuclease/exonuclease/phosphatase family metal-dependent hydrolase